MRRLPLTPLTGLILGALLMVPVMAQAQLPPPRVLVIFDTSGSMLWDYQSNGDCQGDGSVDFPHRNGCDLGSKLFHAKSALSTIVAESGNVEFGLMRYGQLEPGDANFGAQQNLVGAQYRNAAGDPQRINYDGATNGCGPADMLVDPRMGSNNQVQTWLDRQENFPGNKELRANGYTPLTHSMASAEQQLERIIAADPDRNCRPYFVLLLTDGFQQCPGNNEGRSREEIAADLVNRTTGLRNLRVAGANVDVRTFVVGFGRGTAFVSELDAMARAGGTAVDAQGNIDLNNGTAYQADSPQALLASLQGALGNVGGQELCDGNDNDCDGRTDEGFPLLGQPCDEGQGACAREGVGVCRADGVGVECSVMAGDGQPEVCNDLDDDCDGRTDEGVRNACGGCGAVPREECNGQDDDCDGATDENVLNSCGECGPLRREVCNDQDDDCDGRTDEGALNACGVCGDLPSEVCDCEDNDCDNRIDENLDCGVVCNCDPRPGGELCNSEDDDCDGIIDEGVLNACGNCGAVPMELCNGLDDDCDGNLDEDFPNRNQPCGTNEGICDSGIFMCVDGQEICNGGTVPEQEICDEMDNDCDGQVDEDANNACGWCGPLPFENCDNIDNDCDGGADNGELCRTGQCVNGECAPECTSGECFGNLVCVNGACLTPCYNTDCPTGWVCQDGECADPCEGISCPTGMYCALGRCEVDDCYNAAGTAACQQGEYCFNGNCIPDPCANMDCGGRGCANGQCFPDQCADTTDCPEGLACVNGACADDPCARVTCAFPLTCVAGQCQQDPCFEVDCPVGRICEAGQCVDDPCNSITCPGGQLCHRGRCQGDGDGIGGQNPGEGGDGQRADAGLEPTGEPRQVTTGDDGCQCDTTEGPSPVGWIGLLGLGLIGIMRRQTRARRR